MSRSRRFCLAVVLALSAMTAAAAEWHVGAGQRFATIRAALGAAAAGDVITVHGGVYREGTLVIDKPITLAGEGWPSLDGERRHEVILVAASHVTIRGFEIRDAGTSTLHDFAGIKVANVSHVTIADNRLLGCDFGIYFAKATDGVVRDNEVLGAPAGGLENGNGIHGWSCARLQITGNRVEFHRDGIYLEFATDSGIAQNRVTSCLRYGLHFMFSHRNEYRENTFMSNGAGVAVMYSRGVRMDSSHFGRSWGSAAYGLLLKDLTDGRITGNTFERNSIGITVQSSTRMVFEGNRFRANGWALQIESSSTDNQYRRNNFQGNSFDLTTNGDLSENLFEGNYWDRAEIYDLNRDGVGDVPYRPLSLFAKLVDRVPAALLLLRSPLVLFLDRAERIFPTLTPDRLFDARPAMRPLASVGARDFPAGGSSNSQAGRLPLPPPN